MSDRQWQVAPAAPAEFLGSLPELPSIVAQLLWHRGVRQPAEVEHFLRPEYLTDLSDPFLYRQMRKATDRILSAIRAGERITIYGDYDADGVTSTATMVEALTALGANVHWYLPERLAEGYGLHIAAIERLTEQGTKLLITVDCGSTNVEEITRANALGLEVIVIDHHHQPAEVPQALAIINPMFTDETYPCRDQSSAGVAYTVVRALLLASDHGQDLGHPLAEGWEKWLLDLTAISTVADMMILQGENRLLVHYGLLVLRKGRRPGLRALLGVMGQEPEKIDEFTIGFQIAPRLNAAGRLQHASLALELLLTKDTDEAYRLAAELHHVNGDRQRLTEMALDEALEQILAQGDQPAYAAYAPHWSPGIIGLVAGRLVERVWRPVVVMTENSGQIVGSGRSIPGFDIMAAMDAGREHFLRFGGHAGACGFTLASAEGRVQFQTWWQSFVDVALPERPAKPLSIDGELALSQVTPSLLDALELLAPYGVGNTRPKFLLAGLTVLDRTTVGSDKQHLRLVARQRGEVGKFIGFRQGSSAAELSIGQTIDVVVEVSWNEWNGRREPQLKIVDWRPQT